MGRRRKTPRDISTSQPQTAASRPPRAQDPSKQYILYRALDTENDTIRLVRVNRQANDPTSVVFTLEEHQIDTAPEYTALSYMWGPDFKTGSIELDGHEIRVR